MAGYIPKWFTCPTVSTTLENILSRYSIKNKLKIKSVNINEYFIHAFGKVDKRHIIGLLIQKSNFI